MYVAGKDQSTNSLIVHHDILLRITRGHAWDDAPDIRPVRRKEEKAKTVSFPIELISLSFS